MFIRRRSALPTLALTLATLAAGCGSDSSTGPSSQPITLDQALAELSLPALSATPEAFGGGAPTLPALVSSGCTYEAASQSYACTPIVASGVTVTQGFTLLDASGGKQAAFDKTSTAAVRANTTIAGTIDDGAGTQLTIDGQQELTLSGLLGPTHTLDGTSTVHIASVGSDLPFETTVATTITGLVLQPPTKDGTHPWPMAGTITVEGTTSIGEGAPDPDVVRVTITFSGTSTVNVSFTGGGISGSCKVDLASQAPSCS
jgi:hypothetical protein